jgi:hypothetical protein
LIAKPADSRGKLIIDQSYRGIMAKRNLNFNFLQFFPPRRHDRDKKYSAFIILRAPLAIPMFIYREAAEFANELRPTQCAPFLCSLLS